MNQATQGTETGLTNSLTEIHIEVEGGGASVSVTTNGASQVNVRVTKFNCRFIFLFY